MIYKSGKEVSAVHFGGKVIATVYKGSLLVWEAINSCFGKGFWVNVKGFVNEDGWKNKQ